MGPGVTHSRATPGKQLRQQKTWRFYRVSRLLLTTLWVMTRERHRVMSAHEHGREDVEPDISALRQVLREYKHAALEMGGLLIKLGQFLSARADLLPAEALVELATLHDEVPAEDFSSLERVLEDELGGPLTQHFAWIDPVPAGSASLGQVHRARLHDGREVAVKVQRPGIGEMVRADLGTIRFVLGVVRRLTPVADTVLDLHELYREFSRMVSEELDYQHEARAAERFARMVATEGDIVVPAVIWEFTTRRVLTLEWVSGIKIARHDALAAAGIDRGQVARRLLDMYFTSVLQHGFYHADPHPGNFFVQPRPAGMNGAHGAHGSHTSHTSHKPHGSPGSHGECNNFTLAVVDFGMMGVIPPSTKRGLRECVTGMIWRDAGLVATALRDLGFVGADADEDAITQAVEVLLARFGDLPYSEWQRLDPREVLSELEHLLYGQPLRLPARFAFLGRAVSMVIGLSASLDPTINFAATVRPYAAQLARASGMDSLLRILGVESLGQLGRILTREGVAMARTMTALPHLAEHVLERVERGDIRLVIQGANRDGAFGEQVSQSIIRNALRRPVPAWVPLGAVGIMAALLYRRRK